MAQRVPVTAVPPRPPRVRRTLVLQYLLVVALIAFVGELVIRRRERYLSENEDFIRSSRALKRARKALAQSRRKREDSHGAAVRVLHSYLSDKVNRPVVGMTRSALAQVLLARGIQPELIDRVETCLTASEAGRYGGPARGEDNGRRQEQTPAGGNRQWLLRSSTHRHHDKADVQQRERRPDGRPLTPLRRLRQYPRRHTKSQLKHPSPQQPFAMNQDHGRRTETRAQHDRAEHKAGSEVSKRKSNHPRSGSRHHFTFTRFHI